MAKMGSAKAAANTEDVANPANPTVPETTPSATGHVAETGPTTTAVLTDEAPGDTLGTIINREPNDAAAIEASAERGAKRGRKKGEPAPPSVHWNLPGRQEALEDAIASQMAGHNAISYSGLADILKTNPAFAGEEHLVTREAVSSRLRLLKLKTDGAGNRLYAFLDDLPLIQGGRTSDQHVSAAERFKAKLAAAGLDVTGQGQQTGGQGATAQGVDQVAPTV